MSKESKQSEFHNAVLKGLENLDAKVEKSLGSLDEKVDKLRTEDVPGIHIKIALLEEKLTTLKDDVRKEAKRDARIYGGIGSVVTGLFAFAMTYLKH